MQCSACGYTRDVLIKYVNTAILYKSGKNKGKVKGTELEEVKLELGDEDFNQFKVTAVNTSGYQTEITLYICPKCETVRMVSV